MNKILSILFLFPLLFFSACKKQAKEKPQVEPVVTTAVDVPVPVEKQTVVMQVEGVECPLCAQLVVDKLGTIDGIKNTRYVMQNENYEEGYVQFNWHKEVSIPLKEVLTKLEAQGFTVLQITGPCFGKFLFNYKQQQVFSFDDAEFSFPISLSQQDAIPIDDENWSMLLDKGSVEVVATLKRTEDNQAFIFVPKRLYEAV